VSAAATAPRLRSHAGAGPHRRADPGVVKVAGELDLVAAPRVRTRLLDAVERHPAGIVIDLSRVVFADGRGLAALVAAGNRALALGCPLPVLRGTPKPVALLLKASGTQALFPQQYA
jgi:anti-sigma B factor antagonist